MRQWIRKIISGGQTGVDRAALDFAMEHGVPHGGYCPKGRKAEDGRIPDRYQLVELTSPRYEERTEKNLLDCDGTLILDYGPLHGGTKLTVDLCLKYLRPLHIIDLDEINADTKAAFWKWVNENAVRELNVAGSRESKKPIYERAKACLELLFRDDKSLQ